MGTQQANRSTALEVQLPLRVLYSGHQTKDVTIAMNLELQLLSPPWERRLSIHYSYRMFLRHDLRLFAERVHLPCPPNWTPWKLTLYWMKLAPQQADAESKRISVGLDLAGEPGRILLLIEAFPWWRKVGAEEGIHRPSYLFLPLLHRARGYQPPPTLVRAPTQLAPSFWHLFDSNVQVGNWWNFLHSNS